MCQTQCHHANSTRFLLIHVYRDSIGEAKFKGLPFVEVLGTSQSMSMDNVYDGVIGMGKFPGSSFTSLVNLMLKCGLIERGVFNFRFCGTHTLETSPFRAVKGDLVFGNTRTDYSDGPMTYVQLQQSIPWVITVDAIYIDSIPLCVFCVVSIHTGEPRTTGPRRMIETILKRLTETDRQNGKIFVRCKLDGIIPTLILHVKGRYFYIPLTKLMSPRFHSVDGPECDSGFELPADYQAGWIFGISLLRNFHLVFHEDVQLLGFARVHC
ncbi:hypothetical protein CRM22_010115 [Opisthorchis felineus]|uniref:Peptidase A1 domain-containing protein n=1 Tax=Opisthorchis felineus TaxID=147828 RepID=A0A4S2L8C8_OPIFE|nr:hypothetical protein CRM22_010115 [Opisthorchis felineus]